MSHYNNSCVANMTSDITFRLKSTSRKKNWNFISIVALTQLTKYSRNYYQTVYKKHALISDKFLMKLSTHPESTVVRKISNILPCRNKILYTVLG